MVEKNGGGQVSSSSSTSSSSSVKQQDQSSSTDVVTSAADASLHGEDSEALIHVAIKIPSWLTFMKKIASSSHLQKSGPHRKDVINLSLTSRGSAAEIKGWLFQFPEFAVATQYSLTVLSAAGDRRVLLPTNIDFTDLQLTQPGLVHFSTDPNNPTIIELEPKPYSLTSSKAHVAHLQSLVSQTPAVPQLHSPSVVQYLVPEEELYSSSQLLVDGKTSTLGDAASVSANSQNQGKATTNGGDPPSEANDGADGDTKQNGQSAQSTAAVDKSKPEQQQQEDHVSEGKKEPTLLYPPVAQMQALHGETLDVWDLAGATGNELTSDSGAAQKFSITSSGAGASADIPLLQPSVAAAVAAVTRAHQKPVRGQRLAYESLVFSAFNPPPPGRQLSGDLFYLLLTTAEGKQVHATAAVNGFFVNSSSSRAFNPTRSGPVCVTLAELIRRVSPQFSAALSLAVTRGIDTLSALISQPFVPSLSRDGVHEWLAPAQEQRHLPDAARAAHWLAHTCDGSDLPLAQDRVSGVANRDDSAGSGSCLCAAGGAMTGNHFFCSGAPCPSVGSVELGAGVLPYQQTVHRDWHDEWISCKDVALISAFPEDSTPSTNGAVTADSGNGDAPSSSSAGAGNKGAGPVFDVNLEVIKARSMSRILTEFVAACRTAAEVVMSGDLDPLNAADDDRESHLYHYMGVLVSFAHSGSNFFGPAVELAPVSDSENVRAGWKAVSNDLLGVQRLMDNECEGVSHILVCVIDVCGWRLCCQSVIPGVLQRPEMICLGSTDHGVKFAESTDQLARQLGPGLSSSLQLAGHTLVDGSGCEHADYVLPLETKGVQALGNRLLLVDWYRPTPRDVNYLATPAASAAAASGANGTTAEPAVGPMLAMTMVCRPELLSSYTRYTLQTLFDAADASAKETGGAQTALVASLLASDQFSEATKFNVNLFTPYQVQYASPDERSTAEQPIRRLGQFLSERCVPLFARALANGTQVPVDGEHLVALMHENGINARYLGQIAALLEQVDRELHLLVVRAMCARAAKAVIFARLRAQHPNGPVSAGLAETVAQCLNDLFGTAGHSSARNPNASTSAATNGGDLFWNELAIELLARFGHQLAPKTRTWLRSVPLLREVCRQTGIVLRARAYPLGRGKGSGAPFSAADVVGLVPRTKQLQVHIKTARDLMERARTLAQKPDAQSVDAALELCTNAQALFERVHGMLHPAVAEAFVLRAAISSRRLGDNLSAVQYQQMAVAIFERVHGLDHFKTVEAYMTLVPYLCESKMVRGALHCSERMLRLLRVVGAPRLLRVQALRTHINVLQVAGHSDLALQYAKVAAALAESRANLYRRAEAQGMLADAHLRSGNSSEAVTAAKRQLALFGDLLGQDHTLTQQANRSLRLCVEQAVLISKMNAETKHSNGAGGGDAGGGKKKKKKKQAASTMHSQPRSAAADAKQSGNGMDVSFPVLAEKQSPLRSGSPLGSFPIDVILRHINGDGDEKGAAAAAAASATSSAVTKKHRINKAYKKKK